MNLSSCFRIALAGILLSLTGMLPGAAILSAAEPATTAAADHTPPPLVPGKTTVVTRDIAYAGDKTVDAEHQKLDIYAPRDAKGLPVVLFVHGGGWTRGDRGEVGSQPRLFNDNGIVLVSVDYRLSPAHRHPAHVQDLAAAIAWTRANIGKYGGDGSKLVLMGHSAGSHLVALVATDARPLQAHGLALTDVKGVISLDGSAFDIPDRIARGGEKLAENCRRAFGEDLAGHRDASPIEHVAADRGIPPFLLIYVTPDSLNHMQSAAFAAKLKEAGAVGTLKHIEGKTHFSLAAELGMEDSGVEEVVLGFVRGVSR